MTIAAGGDRETAIGLNLYSAQWLFLGVAGTLLAGTLRRLSRT